MTRNTVLVALSIGMFASTVLCQDSDQTITNLVKVYDAQDIPGRMGVFLSPQTWLDAATLQDISTSGTVSSTTAVKASVTQSRTDQQTTAVAGTSRTTSPVSKGSVSSLLSFGEEYGGLTESVSGSVTSVQGNVANIIKAISTKEYEKKLRGWS